MSRQPGVASRRLLIACMVGVVSLLAACDYLPPSRSLPPEQQAPVFKAPAPVSQPTVTPPSEVISVGEPTQIPNCTNGLEYIADITVPDGTLFDAGTVIEKEWKVKNNGTCNWNNTYTLRLISGSPLGVETNQSLIPARNGTEAIVHLEFIAPQEPGKYEATWQAYGPDGEAFGEWLSISIAVTTP